MSATKLALKQFGRTIPRILFFPILFLVLALPQLRSESPRTFFKNIQDFGHLGYLIIFLLVLLALLVLRLLISIVVDLNKWRSGMQNIVNTTELVKKEKNGNGLVTAPIPFTWLFLLLTYIYIETGKECAVIDGERIIKKRKWHIKSMLHDTQIRYVLLKPSPLTVTVNDVHTEGALYLASSKIAVTYTVREPIQVVQMTDPIGVLSEHIKSQFTDLVGKLDFYTISEQKAASESSIRESIQKSSNLPMFTIDSVHIEMHLKEDPKNITRIAQLKREQEEKDAQLRETILQQAHARKMEEETMKAKAAVIADMADIAKNRNESVKEFANVVSGAWGNRSSVEGNNVESNNQLLLGDTSSVSVNVDIRYDREINELTNLVDLGIILDYEPRFGKNREFRGADITIDEGKVSILSAEYPAIPPIIRVQLNSGVIDEWQIEGWKSNMTIATAFQSANKKMSALRV